MQQNDSPADGAGGIVVEHLDIAPPVLAAAGDPPLLADLSLKVAKGEHTLIRGRNV